MQEEPITNVEINTYLDNRMSELERRNFQERLKYDQEAQQRLARYQKNHQLLQQAYQPIIEQEIPRSLLPPGKDSKSYSLSYAAALLLFVVGTLFGWQINGFLTPSLSPQAMADLKEQLVQPAAFAHAIYSVEKMHPVEVASNQQQHMDHWLSKRLKTKLNAPNLSQFDFQLVGGRLLPSTEERMAAQYMYQNGQGERVTLYVRRGNWENETEINFTQRQVRDRQYILSYWLDSGIGYVLAGQIPTELAGQLSKSIYGQMSLGVAKTVAKL